MSLHMELACHCMQTALPLTMQGVKQCCHSGVAATRPPRLGTKLMLRDSSGPSLSLTRTGMPYNTSQHRPGLCRMAKQGQVPIIAALAQGVVVGRRRPPRARRGRGPADTLQSSQCSGECSYRCYCLLTADSV